MTQEEIEKTAKEYAIQNYGTEDVVQSNLLQAISKNSFQDGAKWGIANAIEWHDLRKNPNDLPKYKNSMMIWICWINAYGNKCYRSTFYDGKGFYWVSARTCYKKYADGVIAWCELPQFKE